MHLRKIIAASVLFFAVFMVGQNAAWAQSHTLWLATDGANPETEDILADLLNDSASQHYVGRDGLAEAIAARGLTLPSCADGTDTCTSIAAVLAAQLRIRQVVGVRGEQPTAGADERATAQCVVSDPARTFTRVVDVESATLRGALLACIGAITDGEGRARVASEPTGANVFINEEPVGTTPWVGALPLGVHTIRLELDGHHDAHRALEVRLDAFSRAHLDLERSMARLRVVSGTPGVRAQVDGGPFFLAGEEVDVEPGTHELNVSADGYNTLTRTLEFQAGEELDVTATLALSDAELNRRAMRKILDRPLMLQGGLHFGHFGSDWSGANVLDTSPDQEIDCTIRPTTGICDRTGVTSLGLDLEVLYAWRWLEVEPLGLSYRFLSMSDKGTDYRVDASTRRLSHKRGHRWSLRLAHVGARHLINEYWEPYARAGFTLHMNRLRAEDLATGEGDFTLRRNDLALELRAGARFHLNTLVYGYGELGVAGTINQQGTRPEWQIGAGVGINLPLPFGLGAPQSDDDGHNADDPTTIPAPAQHVPTHEPGSLPVPEDSL